MVAVYPCKTYETPLLSSCRHFVDQVIFITIESANDSLPT